MYGESQVIRLGLNTLMAHKNGYRKPGRPSKAAKKAAVRRHKKK